MSTSVIFIIGTIIFAITVYGTVMAGGIALTRRQDAEDSAPSARVGDETAPLRAAEPS
jgi:hypothetical protein